MAATERFVTFSDMTLPPAIACTLDARDLADRLRWVGELNATALRTHTLNGARLVLTYAPEAAARVRELVTRERACCAFLAFALDEARDAVRLTIGAPPGVGDAAAALFAPFLAAPPPAPPADA